MQTPHIVIVGGGQAGATAAAELRRRDFAGQITLIGEEPHLPYERPPLSKDALLDPDNVQLNLHPASFYNEQNISLKLGIRAEAIDAQQGCITLSNGETLRYDSLLLATGAQARRLPELDALGSVSHVLRTLDDANRIRAQLKPGSHVLVVGAGVIGLELASSLVALGATVELIDPASRIMSRNAPEILSQYLQTVHEARGVRFHLGTQVSKARLDEEQKVALTLSNGQQLQGDLLIYGVGVTIDTRLADSAGLHTEQGAIVIDEHGRSSQPAIYAAGDTTVQIGLDGRWQRQETWENANRQACMAVCHMLNQEPAQACPAWFWTDQCDLNIQFAADMAAAHWIVRGNLDTPPFVLIGLDPEGAICGAITVNQGRDMRPLKELIEHRAVLPLEVWTDPSQNLRNLAKQVAQTADNQTAISALTGEAAAPVHP
ncbi:3-phenylpropionate/cinnamic acid dioxygenase ferredoxin--NAD(+) reductase subunit [Alcaligenes faecalis]|uniref:Pyridine nucleotide-disulfide oxidoreductase n=1 Tax=Alcaligenes faecalis TaxID=511 RepID=A0A2U2BMN8_ALCFA|nr:3-phenylpropionate/cinnamic acid dioxygenase ferredoxin--NAD(+) reductase subunit [Alcaligenes faecalis]PWE15281.1 pyridine nucleotide-disulfide oxidoreductase [Alcaligenes faecalis]